jgi:hypothetical protein
MGTEFDVGSPFIQTPPAPQRLPVVISEPAPVKLTCFPHIVITSFIPNSNEDEISNPNYLNENNSTDDILEDLNRINILYNSLNDKIKNSNLELTKDNYTDFNKYIQDDYKHIKKNLKPYFKGEILFY